MVFWLQDVLSTTKNSKGKQVFFNVKLSFIVSFRVDTEECGALYRNAIQTKGLPFKKRKHH